VSWNELNSVLKLSSARQHQRQHLHPGGHLPGPVPRHHVAAEGRVLQVQGQACPRSGLAGQHRPGHTQSHRLLCKLRWPGYPDTGLGYILRYTVKPIFN